MKHADAEKEQLQPADDAMLVLDNSMTIMSCNQTAQRLFADRLKHGDRFNLENYFDSYEANRIRKVLTTALTDGHFGTGLKADIRNSSGRRLSCTYSIQPLHANHGDIIGVILCIQTSSAFCRSSRPKKRPSTCTSCPIWFTKMSSKSWNACGTWSALA